LLPKKSIQKISPPTQGVIAATGVALVLSMLAFFDVTLDK
jgi:hypothetical protein